MWKWTMSGISWLLLAISWGPFIYEVRMPCNVLAIVGFSIATIGFGYRLWRGVS